MRTRFKWLVRLLVFIVLVFFIPVGCALTSHFSGDEGPSDWRTARRDSAGIAPDAAAHQGALIQVYAARAFRWRGALGVHTWIAAKPQGVDHYTRFEVIGFSVRRGGDAVQVAQGIPDGYWYGSQPALLREIRGGGEVDALISRLHEAARLYPYNHEYRVWPGPNSNTFIAYLGRKVPELKLNLPPTAIGKDYLPEGGVFARAPSGSGFQISLAGLLGVTLALEEGFEMNFLGLSAGVDPWPLALNLPGLGRLGFPTHMPLKAIE
ncbi:DUF3750 domain-containing protein [Nitrincola iocasae]|uniref:DUF3750 domain-containing protein n=1 Tax=Nitrincola iocasae TaxID=2614693 RepID=A0A5J6LD57_9GAMM|nr:DUF3750 domain-containing protein [Nitrincola iocasae]QEW06467.1 DUF3750 domain-containing protein [Nitrincola iocasae]